MKGRERHQVALTVNGHPTDLLVDPRSSLADVLRADCGLTGTKVGCEQGACGACTVMYEGSQIRSCLLFAVQAEGAEIWTIEGLMHPPPESGDLPLRSVRALAAAFKDAHALQCGFCTPGMLLAAADLLRVTDGELTEEEIREGLSGNVCRCTGYQGIVEAIVSTFSREVDQEGQP